MATTMKLIGKNVLGSDTASVTFSDIPGTFSDLLIIATTRSTATTGTGGENKLRFNGAASDASHSCRYLMGNGSSASSGTYSFFYGGVLPLGGATANTFSSNEIYIPNYAGSAKKSASVTAVMENNATASFIDAVACLWDSTSAITQIEFLPSNNSYKSGSSFFLYGVTKA